MKATPTRASMLEISLGVLYSLAANEATQDSVAKRNAVSALVTAVENGSDAEKTLAIGALRKLVESRRTHADIARAGGIKALVGVLCDSQSTATHQRLALIALADLAKNAECQPDIVAENGHDVIVFFVVSLAGELVESASKDSEAEFVEAGDTDNETASDKAGEPASGKAQELACRSQ